jgi:hypothetical protein
MRENSRPLGVSEAERIRVERKGLQLQSNRQATGPLQTAPQSLTDSGSPAAASPRLTTGRLLTQLRALCQLLGPDVKISDLRGRRAER